MLHSFFSCAAALLRALPTTAPVALLALLTGAVSGQCYTDPAPSATQITAWSIGFGSYSHISTAHIPLGFAFPVAGAAEATYSTIKVCENGVLQLTNNSGSGPFPNSVVIPSPQALTGSVGSQPWIAPFWSWSYTVNVGSQAGVWIERQPGVRCRIVWREALDYGGHSFSYAAELFATGEVVFSYDHRTANYDTALGTPAVVGLSSRNGVAIAPASDLVPGPTAPAGNMIYESFAPLSFDGASKSIAFTSTPWGWQSSLQCNYELARHSAYGTGCYDSSNSFYELHADAAAASAALTGRAYQFTPVGSLYRISSGGAFLPPVAAVPVFATPSDDGETVVTPSQPLPTPMGPQAALRVHANGIVSWGGGGQTFPGTNAWTPTAAGFLGGANAGIYAWHDYNEAEAGSGRIVREERSVGGETLLVITWNGVENYSMTPAANPSTMQIQCNLTTGVVTLVFPSLDGDTTSQYGSEHLIGCSPAGASPDGGSQSFAQSLPRLAGFDATAMTLSASPAPISTGSAGTLVTYTQSNIPETAPGAGVFVGVTILGFGQDLPGTDLGFLGMPGCNLHLASLDILLGFVGASSTLSTPFQVPAGVPYGAEFFAQSVALIAPGTWNAFGATVSNGVASFVSTF